MDKQNLMPQPAQPINRIATGQMPKGLAELSEVALQLHGDEALSASVLASSETVMDEFFGFCSYDGDDEAE